MLFYNSWNKAFYFRIFNNWGYILNLVKLLIIDDNEKFRLSLARSLKIREFECFTVGSSKEAMRFLENTEVQVILLDLRLGNENGIEVSKKIMEKHKGIPQIMITGFATIDSAVEVLKNGVVDYIQKPIDLKKLVKTINNVIKVSQKSEKVKKEESSCLDCYFWKTENQKMKHCLKLAKQLADSEIPILILGESGTGKEIMAEYIHQNSKRKNKQLQKANCAAFSESLLNNELFGHEKGSYTGAIDYYKGIFERSDKSSLFLDEIGDMPLPLQSKILRAIQNQEIQPIGSEKLVKIDVRFLSATNKALNKMMEEGKFRKDLYYRLNAGFIELPPLRERREDVVLLVKYFMEEISPKNLEVTKPVMNLFMEYPWPGNIRELMNTLQYSSLVSVSDQIEIKDLPSSFINNLQKNEINVDENPNEKFLLEEKEAEFIKKILNKVNNNKMEAANLLGISRSTLYSKMKKFSLDENKSDYE